MPELYLLHMFVLISLFTRFSPFSDKDVKLFRKNVLTQTHHYIKEGLIVHTFLERKNVQLLEM